MQFNSQSPFSNFFILKAMMKSYYVRFTLVVINKNLIFKKDYLLNILLLQIIQFLSLKNIEYNTYFFNYRNLSKNSNFKILF